IADERLPLTTSAAVDREPDGTADREKRVLVPGARRAGEAKPHPARLSSQHLVPALVERALDPIDLRRRERRDRRDVLVAHGGSADADDDVGGAGARSAAGRAAAGGEARA